MATLTQIDWKTRFWKKKLRLEYHLLPDNDVFDAMFSKIRLFK